MCTERETERQREQECAERRGWISFIFLSICPDKSPRGDQTECPFGQLHPQFPQSSRWKWKFSRIPLITSNWAEKGRRRGRAIDSLSQPIQYSLVRMLVDISVIRWDGMGCVHSQYRERDIWCRLRGNLCLVCYLVKCSLEHSPRDNKCPPADFLRNSVGVHYTFLIKLLTRA